MRRSIVIILSLVLAFAIGCKQKSSDPQGATQVVYTKEYTLRLHRNVLNGIKFLRYAEHLTSSQSQQLTALLKTGRVNSLPLDSFKILLFDGTTVYTEECIQQLWYDLEGMAQIMSEVKFTPEEFSVMGTLLDEWMAIKQAADSFKIVVPVDTTEVTDKR